MVNQNIKLNLPELRDYQREAVEKFLEEKRGIISLPTGTGKTVIALKIWEELGYPKTLYIAPTRALIKDLMYKFEMKYNIPGRYLSDNPKKPKLITFATYSMIGTHNPELAKGYDFYILDEAHHAAAKNFFLNALPIILESGKPVLGLSASPKTSSDYADALLMKLPIIYRKTFKEEEMKQFRPKTKLYLAEVDFTTEERIDYEALTKELYETMKKSGYLIRSIVDASKFANKDDALGLLARKYMSLYNERKRLVQKTDAKVEAVVNIVLKHRNEDRIMIFADTVDELLKVINRLVELGIPAFAMTSKTVTRKEIKKINEEFGKRYKVLGLCKMGEEGIDFPDLNVLIIMGSPKSERAILQRVGRVLRFKEGKTAHIYFVYVRNTFEEETAHRYLKKIHPDEVVRLNLEELKEEIAHLEVEEKEDEIEVKSVEVEEIDIKVVDIQKSIDEYRTKAIEIEKEVEELKKKVPSLQLWLNPKYAELTKEYQENKKRAAILEAISKYLKSEISYNEFIRQLKQYKHTPSSIILETWIDEKIRESLSKKIEQDKEQQKKAVLSIFGVRK